jgi:small-conductance mechanosensitive channel
MFRTLLIAIISLFSAASWAVSPEIPSPQLASAPVLIHGRPLFELRGRVGASLPIDRAKLLSSRLEALIDDESINPDNIVVTESMNLPALEINGLILLTVTPADAEGVHLTSNQFAEQSRQTIQNAVRELRSERSPRHFAIKCGWVALLTLAFFLFLWGTRRLRLFLSARLAAEPTPDAKTWLPSLSLKGFELVSRAQMGFFLSRLAGLAIFASRILVGYFIITTELGLFWRTSYLAPQLLNFLLAPVHLIGQKLIAFLPNALIILTILILSRYLIQFIHFIFRAIEKQNLVITGFRPDWAPSTAKLVSCLVVIFSVILIFPYLPGSSSPAFQGISVFIGLLVTLGSGSAVSNTISGVVLTYMRPYQVGDRVKIADTFGDVIEKSLLVTRIRTDKQEDVTIPNSSVLNQHIINYSSAVQERGVILHSEVTLGYDIPWRTIHELMISAARDTKGLLSEPKPYVLHRSLNDFHVTYQINAYTNTPNDMMDIYSELHQNLQDRFNEAGVEILSPSYQAWRDGNKTTIAPKV